MTRNNVSRAHRMQSAIWIVAMLTLACVVSGRSIQASRCPEPKPGAATAAAGQPELPALSMLSTSTGVDLEVRIWNVRIGFPWLKSLPLTPGRRIVVSLWEADADR